MDVTADLINFELLRNRSPREILEEVFDDDASSDLVFVTSGYKLPGGWSDSARLFGMVADAVEHLCKGQEARAPAQGAFAGLARLFLYDHMPDELKLRSVPDELYIASISPQTAADILAQLNDEALAVTVGELSRRGFGEGAAPYLEQWIALVSCAANRNLGILIHNG